MTINVSPASRDLTAAGNYSKTAERLAIIIGKRAFLKAGGVLGVYRQGAAWNKPCGARRILPGGNREVFASRADYVRQEAARRAEIAEKRAAKASESKAARESRSMAFNTADGREGPDGRHVPANWQ